MLCKEMDDSFDELIVPDNWLDCVPKRKLEESTDVSFSCTKQPRLCAPPSSISSSFKISTKTEALSDSEIPSETETNEDTTINEPYFISDEDFSFKLDNNSSSAINSCSSASEKQRELQTGMLDHLRCFSGDGDSSVHLEIYSSFGSENRSGIAYNKSIQETQDKTENLDNENDLNVNTNSYPIIDTEETMVRGNSKMVNHEEQIAPKNSTEIAGLKKVLSVVKEAQIIADVVPGKDFDEIYRMLLENRDKNNRLDIVTCELTNPDDSSSVDIFEEVRQVALAMPSASVNDIFTMLEQLLPTPGRVQNVITNLMSSGVPASVDSLPRPDLLPAEKNSSIVQDDSFLENDPLLQDMRTIAKMFPEKDRNEIYALLEANFKKENRLENVINEILHVESANLGESQQSQSQAAGYTMDDSINYVVSGDTFGHDMERMRNIFPDCDPNYLYEKLDSMKDIPNCTDVLAAEMFEKRDYPKLKDLLDKEREKEKKNKAKHLTMTPKEFLQKFPDPLKTFQDGTKEPSVIYKQHSELLMENEFPMLKSGYLKKVLVKHGCRLYPSYQEVSALLLKTPLAKRRKGAMFLMKPKSVKLPMPDTVDEYFYHELWFVYNDLSVLDYIKQNDEKRKLKIEQAKINSELCECCCCYDDECLLEDLASCPEGHLFCKTCVLRSTEAAFGEMKTKFPCLTGECDQDIPLSYLQTIIPAGLFSKIVRRLQEEEVQQANIPDLVACPFCPFAAIMSNPNDKVFKCLNPDCLKESCRLCQEPNHVPLRCNEVEKKTATDMRVYIENKISEAVMRKCHKCGKRFVKDTGCNKMTCVCGATSCYACKATDIDYDHFNNNTKCANTDPDTIHQQDMENAAIQAKNQYLLDHPEAADVELKTDVKDMIKDFRKSKTAQDGRLTEIYNEYNADEEEEDTSDYEDLDYHGYGSDHDVYDESDNSEVAYYY